jgi:predicted RNA-binding Zn-ribbon protein involved in translation (DUF1610 family)
MENSMKHECVVCSAEFTLKFEDEDFETRYCPSCGNELMSDIELIENIDPDLLYDEFDE